MKFSVLQGLDLSHANSKGTPPAHRDASQNGDTKTQSRLRSRRSANDTVLDEVLDEDLICTPPLDAATPARSRFPNNKRQFSQLYGSAPPANSGEDVEMMSERRRSLFEPLGPNAVRSLDSFLPPPDFDVASYPRGWVIGKKRKLVNVDVVESMRRIAVQEMNRKVWFFCRDREIGGLNEQLEEDARTMEHLQLELQQERQKRMQAEREKSTLQAQADMLVMMLNELEEDAEPEQFDGCQVINN